MQLTKAAPLRIVLADDHAMLREGLSKSLSGLGFSVVAEASDGAKAIAAVDTHLPDAVLLDVTMPVMDGLDAAKRIAASHPNIRVIILTMHADTSLARKAKEVGASGYLVKDCTTEDIVSAIEAAMNGQRVFPPSVDHTPAQPESPITQREAEVLQLIANGRNTNDVATELYVSVKTVKNHLGSIYSKLDAHDRTQAVLKAARLGIITLSSDQG